MIECENSSERENSVKLKFVLENDVEHLTHCLADLLDGAVKDGKRKSAAFRSSVSSSQKGSQDKIDGEHEEVLKLMDEELPEEYMEHVSNKLSDGLLVQEQENHFGFQTPKKRRGMTLKAQESANKYYGTPSKNETSSKSVPGTSDNSPAKTPSNKNQSLVRSTRSRISFGGEMGATPSKGINLNGTPTKSALRKSRRSIMEEPITSSRRGSAEMTAKRSLKRITSNEDLSTRTPTRRQSIVPRSMETISEGSASVPKTPYNIRARTRACITNAIKKSLTENDSESDASLEDFSSDDEEDEYKPNADKESSEAESEDDVEEGSEQEENAKSPVRGRKSALTLVVKKDVNAVTPSRSRRREVNYEFATDAYFETFASKDVTSNNTLSRLRNPRLREDTLRDLLKDTDAGHKEPIGKLTNEYHTLFHRWLFTLQEGFNVLLFGLGSKRHILQSLHDEMLCDSQVLVVNGFFPGLTVKEILDTILTGLLGARDVPANPLEAVELIEKIQSGRHADTLYLLIHNLDGPSLKNSKAQTVLSKLAKIPNVRLIASIDHINAPLMWDQTKLHRFNFSWWDVTTFMPYSVETSFESSLLIQRSGALQLSSLHSVFKSLTANAKKIYLMIAKHQLENSGNHAYSGLPFQELYWAARNAFVVSTQMALRAQLTEFLDHHMVKMKRGGEETLLIPIDNALIQQFVQSQEEKE